MKNFKKLLAIVLAISMVLSFAACGNPTPEKSSDDSVNSTPVGLHEDENGDIDLEDLALEDPETIINILDPDIDTSKLSDKELEDTAHDLLDGINKVDDENTIDVNKNKDAYDENGAMTKPFDEVYPEAIEDEIVEYSDETILVKMSNSKNGRITLGMFAAGVAKLDANVPLENETWYKASLRKGTDAQKALENLRELKEIILAEYDYKIKTAAIDEYQDIDASFGLDCNEKVKEQWYLNHCGIPEGFNYMKYAGGQPNVIVAVIDSGVDIDHEDLAHNIWKNTKEKPDNGIDDDGNGYIDDYYGVNIISGKGNGDDDNGHGTHVAGIIAAQNNNLGTVGIAYKTTIMPIKAAASSGYLLQSDIAKAVLYAYENGAEVINMSFGGSACSIAVQDALASAYTRCVLVASAGNDGKPNEPAQSPISPLPNYPAALTYVLGVMAVDQYGRETSFTNWDYKRYNGKEYELYAPGFNIMSTLPNDTYGTLSGTSMAAPVVSAMAAILRSEFADRDTYPTKFIYGQLTATSEHYADCFDPDAHGVHNIPQIAHLYSALTKLPKPDIGMQDFLAFDTIGLSQDTDNVNNGDGVIDAGETISLGLILRNRWGMSKDTYVTLDTINGTVADPYVTFVNPTVNYDSVGTYSTQDCGKIYTDDLHTGWENPFILKIAKDCPNDYIVKVNVHLSYKNGLDETDETIYTNELDPIFFTFTVRNGVILPSVIEEDMTLTPDNLYIIPNSTVITEGTTVTVEPGTNIQFWSDDPCDPYADTYIAKLTVNGKFLVDGTKENPVNIYPSDLMDRYNVELTEAGNGFISLKYAEVTNLALPGAYYGTEKYISYAEHCTFRLNYNKDLCYRELVSGNVKDRPYSTLDLPFFRIVKDSIFYKLGSSENTVYFSGNAQRCIFADCGITFDKDNFTAQNCVFLGNTFLDQTNPNQINCSSMQINRTVLEKLDDYSFEFYYKEDTGATYILCTTRLSTKEENELLQGIRAVFGGSFAKFETKEEAEWLDQKYSVSTWSGGADVYMGIYADENGEFLWYDGTPVDTTLLEDPSAKAATNNPWRNGKIHNTVKSNSYYYRYLFEIPGKILPTEITFPEYEITIDKNATYQIAPQNTPVQLYTDAFIYEATDENVVTVSEGGLVTPVGNGTTEIFVYSEDRAVYNYITFSVTDYVALEDFSFTYRADRLVVGEQLIPSTGFTPADTTRRNIEYSSSDPSIIDVESDTGIITAVSSGTATITATCEGISHTYTLEAYVKATSLDITQIATTMSLDSAPALPEVVVTEGAKTNLEWSSTDEKVLKIVDNAPILLKEGTTTLTVTDTFSGLSDTILIYVTAEKMPKIIDIQADYNYAYALAEDGKLYRFDETTPTCILENVEEFYMHDGNNLLALLFDGSIVQVIYDTKQEIVLEGINEKIIDLTYYDSYKNLNKSAYLRVVTESGKVYVWDESISNTPYIFPINEEVIGVDSSAYNCMYLTASGNLYYEGFSEGTTKLIARNVTYFSTYGSNVAYISEGKGYTYDIPNDKYFETDHYYDGYDYVYIDPFWQYSSERSEHNFICIKNGELYINATASNESYLNLSGMGNICSAFSCRLANVCGSGSYGTAFFVSESGLLYGIGKPDVLGGATTKTITTPVVIPIVKFDENIEITKTNANANNIISEQQLITEINKSIVSIDTIELYENGGKINSSFEINRNKLTVTTPLSFVEGSQYTLVIPAQSIIGAAGVTNSEDIKIDFTYTEPSETPDVPETPETSETPEEKVVHESVTDSSIARLLDQTQFVNKLKEYQAKVQFNPNFYKNAILNRISTDTNVEHWLRPAANTTAGLEIPLGGNWWGTTNETAIGLQMVDYSDYTTYGRFMYEPYLTSAPENTFPFVTDVKILNKNGEEVTTVGNEQITVQVTFNRDMDTSIPLQVRFGSAYPYGDYEIEGKYVDARTWEGKYKLTTIIENGIQYFTIENGCSATEDLQLMRDRARFSFEIDTTAAQALIMQGEATDTGIFLTWTQDDFDTLMGYNVYRSTSEDGLYTRVNQTVIPADTMEFFDDTVEPGVQYYYNFTVVQTDLSESDPSGKISIMSKDTMAPDIYHSPVYNATTGSNLVISATVTDNLNITYARVYYRIKGEDEWRVAVMNNLNDKYSAIIIADHITVEGLEYYIEAFDGVSYTYKGSAEAPYFITVQEVVSKDAMGDVNGDGAITNLDALMLLKAINDQLNLTPEQFARADLNGDGVLVAKEALCILQYVSGAIGSVDMREEANA